jgi:hypothetical protein
VQTEDVVLYGQSVGSGPTVGAGGLAAGHVAGSEPLWGAWGLHTECSGLCIARPRCARTRERERERERETERATERESASETETEREGGEDNSGSHTPSLPPLPAPQPELAGGAAPGRGRCGAPQPPLQRRARAAAQPQVLPGLAGYLPKPPAGAAHQGAAAGAARDCRRCEKGWGRGARPLGGTRLRAPDFEGRADRGRP